SLILVSCDYHHYTTSLVLPPKPIEKGQIDVNGGIEIMPASTDEPIHAPGISVSSTFGIDHLKGINTRLFWADDVNGGLSVSLLKGEEMSKNRRIYHCPRIGTTIGGYGTGIALGYEFIFQKSFNNASFYTGIGVGVGADADDLFGDYGTALTSKFGLSIMSKENLRLSLEFNPIIQSYEGEGTAVYNSSISVGYLITKNKTSLSQ
ncbi:MAG: hypothetical protein CL823_01415, partial [Crocinitomicaceae bacterium]|nr:hypothetical protein [Crocinitomicaceae bacterium]